MQKQTLPFYQMSDGLLLPTLYDPFPNVVPEAMACALPVITSTTCGGAEFISQGEEGLSVMRWILAVWQRRSRNCPVIT